MDLEQLLDKYWEIIKEEVNVKEVMPLQDLNIKRIVKPLGWAISSKYGKDTWKIIQLAKAWNWESQDNKIYVIDPQSGVRWELLPGEYEISWEWIDEKNMGAEDNVVVSLDTSITQDLYQEWVAREISRFLNQMRKEAWYDISDRVNLYYQWDQNLEELISKFKDFLAQEALLSSLQRGIPQKYDIFKKFINWEEKISFYLQK